MARQGRRGGVVALRSGAAVYGESADLDGGARRAGADLGVGADRVEPEPDLALGQHLPGERRGGGGGRASGRDRTGAWHSGRAGRTAMMIKFLAHGTGSAAVGGGAAAGGDCGHAPFVGRRLSSGIGGGSAVRRTREPFASSVRVPSVVLPTRPTAVRRAGCTKSRCRRTRARSSGSASNPSATASGPAPPRRRLPQLSEHFKGSPNKFSLMGMTPLSSSRTVILCQSVLPGDQRLLKRGPAGIPEHPYLREDRSWLY